MNIPTTFTKLFVLAILTITFFSGCGGGKEAREEKYLTRASEHLDNENFTKARIEAKNVLQINPKNTEAILIMAKIALEDNKLRRAFANIQAALEIDENMVEANILAGKIYLSAKQSEKAREYFDKVVTLEPKHIEARSMLAALEASEQNTDKAIEICNEILVESPGNPEATAVLASIYNKESVEKALDILDKGLAIYPKSTKLKRIKIRVLTGAGRSSEAEGIYKELIRENPDRPAYYYSLAQVYERNDKHSEAESLLRKAIEANQDENEPVFRLFDFVARNYDLEKTEEVLKEFVTSRPSTYVFTETLAQFYLRSDRLEDAIASLKRVVIDSPESTASIMARNDLIRIYLSQQKMDKAQMLLGEIFDLEPNNADALVLRARIKLSENKLEDGIVDLRAAIKNDSDSLEAFNLLAQAQEKIGSTALAMDNYRRAVQIGENDRTALMGVARTSIKEKNINQAEQALARVLSVSPTDVDAVTMMSKLLVGKKQWDRAYDINQTLVQSQDDNLMARGYAMQANILRAQKRWDEATPRYKKALELEPEAYETVAGVVDSFLVKNDADGALAFLNEHLKSYPNIKFGSEIQAKVHEFNNDLTSAIEVYKQLVEENPDSEVAYHKLAEAQIKNKQHAEAETTFLAALKKNSDFSGIRILLGNLYEQQARYQESKTQYEQALKINPSLDIAKNNLAVILLNQFPSEENFQKALDLTSDFSNSETPNFLDTLGWTHYHLGNMPQAISFLQAAIESYKNPEFHYHLGAAYHKSGQFDLAKKELELATASPIDNATWYQSAKDLLATL